MQPAKDIETPPIWLIGKIGQIVVLKTIDPIVIVEIYTEEKLRSIDIVTKEWLLVIRGNIADGGIVILIKVRNEIVVLIPSWINRPIVYGAEANPIGIAILVVIIVDKFVEMPLAIIILDITVGIDQKGRGRIGLINGVSLTV